mmetsp:Transcript_47901/g.76401  ORF Transcript_47901/g.76401 Transcript_47901/m.76401 type:complete len:88 (+) Transcript_47901:68-331(+)
MRASEELPVKTDEGKPLAHKRLRRKSYSKYDHRHDRFVDIVGCCSMPFKVLSHGKGDGVQRAEQKNILMREAPLVDLTRRCCTPRNH